MKRARPPNWNRGPKVFRVSWRWRREVSIEARGRARLAIGGWLDSIDLEAYRFEDQGRHARLYVEGLLGADNLGTGRIADPIESGRAIHSFVVQALDPLQHEGPISSGLRTSRRQGIKSASRAADGLRAIKLGLRRLRDV